MLQPTLPCLSVLILTIAALAPLDAGAQEAPGPAKSHTEEHAYYKHVLGVFIGAAHEEFGRRENGFALGIEYEYRLGQRFGVGAIVEHTVGDLDTWVYALPFAYHNGPWKLYAAPGIEEAENGRERMLRLGVEYGFHFNKWEVSPQVDVDIIGREGEVFVLGVTFARGFGL
jgi:hypothetical protein